MKFTIRDMRQKDDAGKPMFKVISGSGESAPAALQFPWEITVGGRADGLFAELAWYQEKYLELTTEDFQKRADEIKDALFEWGRSCFNALFGARPASDWYARVRGDTQALNNLIIEVESGDAAILSWPWEALNDGELQFFATRCRFERRIGGLDEPITDIPGLDGGQLNILYIIARPGGDRDPVGFQTLARPLADLVREEGWPVRIDVLRPPTFAALRELLEENPNFYHIVHFDGHGGFSPPAGAGYGAGHYDTYERFGAEGLLAFESGEPGEAGELVSAETLGRLLNRHNIPLVALNACQSAMMGSEDDGVYASVAGSLLRAGVRVVVAMSYSLWLEGAEYFVKTFYKSLFKQGLTAEAIRAGREEMYVKRYRDTLYGEAEFHDWIVPVLYNRGGGSLPKVRSGQIRESALRETDFKLDKYGIIGRDRDIRRLEEAIREKPAGILIHGMAGEGKSTLARGFLRWLEDTNGLGEGCLWFTFERGTTVESLVHNLLLLLGVASLPSGLQDNINLLTQILKQTKLFIVWDNFESFSAATAEAGAERQYERDLLRRLLQDLDGGKTKILITSRSKEEWISQECYPVPILGLAGKELWQYCVEVTRRQRIPLRRDADYEALMEKLGGNPLAVRAILLRLKEKSAKALLDELDSAFIGIEGDDSTKRIQAALSVFDSGLSEAYAPALRLLGLHEHHADADLIDIMLKQTGEDAPVSACFAALEGAGLCGHMGNNLYRLHPALRTCLARVHPAAEAGKRVFVDTMGRLANEYGNMELHEQRDVFELFGASFTRALKLARELDMRNAVLALQYGLGDYAKNTRNFYEAERLFNRRLADAREYRDKDSEATSLDRLSSIAYDLHDLDKAEDLRKRVLGISTELNDEKGMAVDYHQLGMLAQKRRDFAAAEDWYRQSLDIKLKLKDERGATLTYGQLGNLAKEQRYFDAAENWYRQSLDISLKLKDEHSAAQTYHNLGMVAHERRDFAVAEDRYRQSLDIFLELKDKHSAASTYHQLGIVAQERRDFAAADDRYRQSLDIKLKLNDKHGAAQTYHQLGNLAQERGDFDAAESWYRQSLDIELKLNNAYGAAQTYHQLGNVAYLNRNFDAAEDWYRQSLDIKLKLKDAHGAAQTYHQLGMVAQELRDFDAAEDWYRQSLDIKLKLKDAYGAGLTYHQLGILSIERKEYAAADEYLNTALEIFVRYKDTYSEGITRRNLDRLNKERKGGSPDA
ncbi:MAG: tetratricopeptide repeat protein [Clostridiales bacterium]|jgi:tetratricopeptide (TPR) repeat protein|nr:tetratricopeptide repeat protein [Clostridiales bacterium]